MNTTVFVVMLIYLILVIGIGVWSSKRAKKTTEDYWVAGRSVGAIVNGFAYEAANSSAAAMLGFVALGYVFGLPYALVIGASASVGIFLAMVLVAAPMRRSGFYTLAEFMEARYQSKAFRIISSIITIILFSFYIIPQMKAIGLVGEMVLGIGYVQALIIAAFVVILYSAMGGMWAVTWTDLLQGILLVFTIVGTGLMGVLYLGGLSSTIQQVSEKVPQLYLLSSNIPYSQYIGLFLAIMLFQVSSPHLMVRFFTTTSPDVARKSMITTLFVHPLTYCVGYLLLLSAGVILAPGLEKPDTLTLVIVDKIMPNVAAGILLGGIMAAVMSTIDAMLLAVGAAVSHDMWRYIKPQSTDEEKLRIGTIAICLVGIIAMIAAMRPPELIGMVVALVLGAIGSGFFWPLVLGIYWRRANAAGAITGSVCGVLSFAILNLFKLVPPNAEVLISIPFGLILTVVVSLLTQKPPKESEALVNKIRGAVV